MAHLLCNGERRMTARIKRIDVRARLKEHVRRVRAPGECRRVQRRVAETVFWREL